MGPCLKLDKLCRKLIYILEKLQQMILIVTIFNAIFGEREELSLLNQWQITRWVNVPMDEHPLPVLPHGIASLFCPLPYFFMLFFLSSPGVNYAIFDKFDYFLNILYHNTTGYYRQFIACMYYFHVFATLFVTLDMYTLVY